MRHLPLSSQIEYKQLVLRMSLLEQKKRRANNTPKPSSQSVNKPNTHISKEAGTTTKDSANGNVDNQHNICDKSVTGQTTKTDRIVADVKPDVDTLRVSEADARQGRIAATEAARRKLLQANEADYQSKR